MRWSSKQRGADRIVVHRAAPDLTHALGVFDGLDEPGYLDRLRSEERTEHEPSMSACVLDTDVVIAALDRADAHHSAAARALRRLAAEEVELLLCAVNYAESLVRPAGNERALRTAVGAIASLRIRVVSPNAAIARNAARHRGLGISLADGFALADSWCPTAPRSPRSTGGSAVLCAQPASASLRR